MPARIRNLFSSVTQIGLEDTLRRACAHRLSCAPVIEASVPWNEACHDDWPLLAHRTSLAVSAPRTAVILQSRAAPGRRVLEIAMERRIGIRVIAPRPPQIGSPHFGCVPGQALSEKPVEIPGGQPFIINLSSTAPLAADPKGDQSTLVPRASLSAEVAQTGAMWS